MLVAVEHVDQHTCTEHVQVLVDIETVLTSVPLIIRGVFGSTNYAFSNPERNQKCLLCYFVRLTYYCNMIPFPNNETIQNVYQQN